MKFLYDKIVKGQTLYYLQISFLIFTLNACSSGEKTGSEAKLPILGRVDYVEKKVNDQVEVDTVYHTIGDYKFVDQDSNFVTPETFKNKIYVADFFFTTCPTICPLMKAQMLRVYKEFENNDHVAFLSHSIDPEYDTVALLHDFAERLGVKSNKWHFITGDKDKIYDIGQKSYMVTAMEDDNEQGGYLHSGAFILVDEDRRIRGLYDGTKPEEVDKMMNDMRRLLKEYHATV